MLIISYKGNQPQALDSVFSFDGSDASYFAFSSFVFGGLESNIGYGPGMPRQWLCVDMLRFLDSVNAKEVTLCGYVEVSQEDSEVTESGLVKDVL